MKTARLLPGDDIYYFHNGQGDVSILADTAGNTAASYIFDAYGNQSEENTVYNPFGYRGEYTDSESGLVYLRARMYDPETGRFINEDPARDNYNWYVYCGNNPIMLIDPSGLFDYNDRLGPSKVYNHDVKVLQNELAWLGCYSGDIDGYFGQQTLDAVNWYKYANNLGNTGADWGVVGAQTWSSMGLIYRTQQDIDAGVEIINGGVKQYFDISVPVTTAVLNSKSDFENHKLDIDWFIGQVKNQGRWNVKRNAQVWSDTLGISTNSYNKTVFFYGRPVVIDDIGNITYGYLGKAAGFPSAVLKGGSMGYHILNHGMTEFKNEFLDEGYIQLGVDWYEGKEIQVRFDAS